MQLELWWDLALPDQAVDAHLIACFTATECYLHEVTLLPAVGEILVDQESQRHVMRLLGPAESSARYASAPAQEEQPGSRPAQQQKLARLHSRPSAAGRDNYSCDGGTASRRDLI